MGGGTPPQKWPMKSEFMGGWYPPWMRFLSGKMHDKNLKKNICENIFWKACEKIQSKDFDLPIPNLMAPGPHVAPPMIYIGKINISWGVGPPHEFQKWLGNDLPSHLQGWKFACTEILSWQTSLDSCWEAGAWDLTSFWTENFRKIPIRKSWGVPPPWQHGVIDEQHGERT